nr:unnamed protein product [Callosobruchus chinensis]
MDDKFLQIEKAKLEIFQRKNREESDSERQFLMSLLPFLKAVPRNRQMLVRRFEAIMKRVTKKYNKFV